MQQTISSVSIAYFACTLDDARDEVRQQRICDWWVFDWPDTDYYWLFGNQYWANHPLPDHSPLARHYYDRLTGELDAAISAAYQQCENRHYAIPSGSEEGLRLMLSSRLDGGHAMRAGSARQGIEARLSVPFAPGSTPPIPIVCPLLQRELFAHPVAFDYTIHSPANSNFRWDLRNPTPLEPEPYFELYGRTLRFSGNVGAQYLGELHLVADRIADLWVHFEQRPIPASVAGRVDARQPLSYQVSPGAGYFGIAAAIELTHLESGQIWSGSVYGADHAPGEMTPYNGWPSAWEPMSIDAGGVIRHQNIDMSFWASTLDPDATGLPGVGTYRLRYILLAYGYQTFDRYVTSTALGSDGDTRLSWKPIQVSHLPALVSYTPGMTDGIIPPFELTYARSAVLANGIEFDAVFDLKNITTFRFVVRLRNTLDFAVGVIVRAAGWQAWVVLQPEELRHLAGGVSVSGMSNSDAYPLHPLSPHYGWQGNWGNGAVSMSDGQATVSFSLLLTAPVQPETVPAGIPALRATWPWVWDPGQVLSDGRPQWAAIKRYAPDGAYDYQDYLDRTERAGVTSGVIRAFDKSTPQPAYQTLINPGAYFVTGYDTSPYDWASPWHKRPWPRFAGWSALTVPIMCRGEKQNWDGSKIVWIPVDEVPISLTREMVQEVAAHLGVTESVVMDGDDVRWFVPGSDGSWHNVLWIDRFYTRSGTLIGDAAMRAAFQAVLDAHTDTWTGYRNLVVHPSVRFGSFLDNGGFEVGDYFVGPQGDLVEVSSLDDLDAVSTRFLYQIQPDFQ